MQILVADLSVVALWPIFTASFGNTQRNSILHKVMDGRWVLSGGHLASTPACSLVVTIIDPLGTIQEY